MFSPSDYIHMAHALRLAERGLYSTSPNPRVGCVLVHNNQTVASGWHEKAGCPHAEIIALNQAGQGARHATAYITLEPCSHYGRTPPCANALIEAGIARVVMAMQDPNPLVSGCGRAMLEQAGIKVQAGLLHDEAQALNRGFVSRMTRRRPWVRLKIASSLDGRIALNNGASQWITGNAARLDGHRWRARSCAIMTGIGTVKADNPQLTVRDLDVVRQPTKIVVDSKLDISCDARLLQEGNTVIFTANLEKSDKKAVLEERGVRIFVEPNENAKVDVHKMFSRLADLEMNEVLVEAGGELGGVLVEAGLVDELIFYFSPQLLGDCAQPMLRLPELTKLHNSKKLTIKDVRMIGKDFRILTGFQ